MRIQFGACTFDSERRELQESGRPARLSPKAFELLAALVEGRPRALSKNELLGRLWPDDFASESNLAGLVVEIRRTIGDDAREPRYLRTVHGYGYAFSAGAARKAQENAVCRLLWGAREIPLAEGENTLGRDPRSLVVLEGTAVSRHHARIVIAGSRAALEDLGSKNGTWLRGRRVATSETLADGDEIRIGSVALTFRRFSSGGSTAGP